MCIGKLESGIGTRILDFGPELSTLEELGAAVSNTIQLRDIAHGRSGDKGNHANVAVIAYTAGGYAWLREHLRADDVAAYFATLQPSRVERFEAANVLGLNFLLYDVLAGGASRSLRIDTQGKTLASALLQMELPRPKDFVEMRRR